MMQREEAIRDLPEELVERIVTMMPFPFVCKARLLSKSWMTRFSPISSLHDEEDKRCAISFQKQIGERSTGWKTLCPVTVNRREKQELDLYGYEMESRTWQRLPSLSFLPGNFWIRQLPEDWPVDPERILQIQGTLLLVTGSERGCSFDDHVQLYVANILTRSWKQLPPPNKILGCAVISKLVNHTRETYKVVILSSSDLTSDVQIYDSESAAWKDLEVSYLFKPLRGPATYLDGLLFIAGHTSQLAINVVVINIVIINIIEETLEHIQYVVTLITGPFDPESQVMSEVLRDHTGQLEVGGKTCSKLITYDDCVFVGGENDERIVLVFSNDGGALKCLPVVVNQAWPDLNPFVGV